MKRILFFLASILILASCKKVDPEKSSQDIMRGGNWRQTSGKYVYRLPSQTTDNIVDYYTALPDCKKDDYITFKSNFDGGVNEGATKCDPSDRSELPFTWDISGDGKVMHVFNATGHFGTDAVNGKVLSISDGAFSVQYIIYQTFSGVVIPVTFTNTYVRI